MEPLAASGPPDEALEPSLGIGEVTRRTGLSAHTLRFYEQEGLFPEPVRRTSSGRRVYSPSEVEWLLVCIKLRGSGMPVPAIRRYLELYREGPKTVLKRLELMVEHRDAVRRQITELQSALHAIEAKVDLYARSLDAGSAHGLPGSAADCDPS